MDNINLASADAQNNRALQDCREHPEARRALERVDEAIRRSVETGEVVTIEYDEDRHDDLEIECLGEWYETPDGTEYRGVEYDEETGDERSWTVRMLPKPLDLVVVVQQRLHGTEETIMQREDAERYCEESEASAIEMMEGSLEDSEDASTDLADYGVASIERDATKEEEREFRRDELREKRNSQLVYSEAQSSRCELPAKIPTCCQHHALNCVRHEGTDYDELLKWDGRYSEYGLRDKINARAEKLLRSAGRWPNVEDCGRRW